MTIEIHPSPRPSLATAQNLSEEEEDDSASQFTTVYFPPLQSAPMYACNQCALHSGKGMENFEQKAALKIVLRFVFHCRFEGILQTS